MSTFRQYLQGFAEHEILERSDHHIVFGKPGSSQLRAHFALVHGGFVIAGDIETACFQYSSFGDLEQRIRWIGESKSSTYVAEKWGAGMGFSALKWNGVQAEIDALRELEDAKDERAPLQVIEDIEDAVSAAQGESEREYYLALNNARLDEIGGFGQATRPRVLQAWACCAALAKALDQ